jgi:hypothetical protein
MMDVRNDGTAPTDVAPLLAETIAALEHFDNDALGKLLRRAEQMSDTVLNPADLAAALPQQQALGELLAATGRNLRMLRRLRGEQNDEERMQWVR